VIKDKPASLVN